MEDAEIKKAYFSENIWWKNKPEDYQEIIEPAVFPILQTKVSKLRTFIYNLVFDEKF